VTALRIRLPAKPDNVAVVRQALTGLGDAYELDPDFLSDIRTAVTEACNNVVIHAYPGGDPGILEVEADPGDGTSVDVLVRDYGAGLQPNTVPQQERSLGLGLPLIAALTRSFEIRSAMTGGLEVHMLFASPDGAESEEVRAQRLSDEAVEQAAPTAGMSIVPGPLVSAISSRVTAMLAARADFPLDRLADAVLVSDAVSAHAEEYVTGGDVGLAIQDGEGQLDFRVGPLRAGGAKGLLSELEVPGFGGSLERLVDKVSVEEASSGQDDEYLVLTIRREES
jgi:anti-sigma regulatory factor (Ser/Thr protein kinase)